MIEDIELCEHKPKMNMRFLGLRVLYGIMLFICIYADRDKIIIHKQNMDILYVDMDDTVTWNMHIHWETDRERSLKHFEELRIPQLSTLSPL